MKMTLAQRLQKIMDDHKINQVELAAIAGCTKGRINQMLRDADPSEVMSPRYAYPIAEQLGYEPRWIMLGDGAMQNIAALNHRVEELLHNYAKCDERGRQTVLIVAEREAQYNKEA